MYAIYVDTLQYSDFRARVHFLTDYASGGCSTLKLASTVVTYISVTYLKLLLSSRKNSITCGTIPCGSYYRHIDCVTYSGKERHNILSGSPASKRKLTSY